MDGPISADQCGCDHFGDAAVWRRRCGGGELGSLQPVADRPTASGLATAEGDFPITLVETNATTITGTYMTVARRRRSRW